MKPLVDGHRPSPLMSTILLCARVGAGNVIVVLHLTLNRRYLLCIAGSIPTELGELVNLKGLYLDGNNLSGKYFTPGSGIAVMGTERW